MRATSRRESQNGLLRPSTLLVPAAAAMLVSVGVLIPQTFVRAAIVFPIALLLPGYAILLLAFGQRRRLGWVPALSLSALLSMAFYPLAGLLLYAASIAPSTMSIVGAVDALVAAALAVSLVRNGRGTGPLDHATWSPTQPPVDEPEQGLDGKRMTILVAVALVLAGLGLVAAPHFEPKASALPYTAFYFTGALSRVSAPVTANGGNPLDVPVAVTNRTRGFQTYQIEPQVDGSIVWPIRTMTLPPGGTWSGSVQGWMPKVIGLHELIIALNMESQGTPVGTLTLWLRSTSPR